MTGSRFLISNIMKEGDLFLTLNIIEGGNRVLLQIKLCVVVKITEGCEIFLTSNITGVVYTLQILFRVVVGYA